MGVDYEGYFECDKYTDISSQERILDCIDEYDDDYDDSSQNDLLKGVYYIYSYIPENKCYYPYDTIEGYYSTRDNAVNSLVSIITKRCREIGTQIPTSKSIIDAVAFDEYDSKGVIYGISWTKPADGFIKDEESKISNKYITCLVHADLSIGEANIVNVFRQRSRAIDKLIQIVKPRCKHPKETFDPKDIFIELVYNCSVCRHNDMWWLRRYKLDSDSDPYDIA